MQVSRDQLLQVLLSKARDIDDFSITKRKRQQRPSVERYPAGFSISDHARPKLVTPNDQASEAGLF